MADAGGVVYLLSSYQSGKERWGHGDGGEGELQEERGGEGEERTPCSSRSNNFRVAFEIQGTVCVLPFDLPGFM